MLKTLRFPAVLCAAITSLVATTAQAQRPLPAEDGRIHAAPTRPVSYLDMAPGSVQVVPLSPRYHTILEFPLNVFRVDMGDRDIGLVEQIGNKVIIKPVAFYGETSFTVMLDDDNLTVVPFLVRPDTAASPVYVLRFTDPISEHVREAEEAIVARAEATAMANLATRAEELVQQRALMGFDVAYFPDKAQASQLNKYGERVTLEVVKVLYMQTSQNVERAYLLYRVANLTRHSIDGLELSLAMEPKGAKKAKASDIMEVYDLVDTRAGMPVPSGTLAEGLLVFDRPAMGGGESFRVTLTNPAGLNVTLSAAPVQGKR